MYAGLYYAQAGYAQAFVVTEGTTVIIETPVEAITLTASAPDTEALILGIETTSVILKQEDQ